MWTLLFVILTTGSPALLQAAPVQGHIGRCSFADVLHVEGTSHYSLTFQQALKLCQSLDYKLATQEQINEAYKKGLRTCRYGWIDGQKITFLPHVNGPNCDSSSTEVTFHSKAAEHLSDVYCFNPSDSSVNCENTVKSNSEGLTNGNTTTENGKPHEDILKEVKTEGFLVDLEEILGRVKREASPLNDTEVPKTVLPDVRPSTVATLDTKGPTNNKPRYGKTSSSVTPSVLFSDTEGSGSASEIKPSQSTTMLTTTEPAEANSIQETPVVQKKGQKLNTGSEGQPEIIANISVPGSSRQDDGPSTWLIIFAFCVAIGAIVCILAAIATREKWYGPRQSRNITTEEHNKDYSKTETLPLSEKEQEIVALMSVTNLKNGTTEDITVTSLEDREKEYLM